MCPGNRQSPHFPTGWVNVTLQDWLGDGAAVFVEFSGQSVSTMSNISGSLRLNSTNLSLAVTAGLVNLTGLKRL